jgi:hypothetical protein
MDVWTYTTDGREYTVAKTLGRDTYNVYARGAYVGTADALAGAPIIADAHAKREVKRAERLERDNVTARQFESARADRVRAENALVWSLIEEAR